MKRSPLKRNYTTKKGSRSGQTRTCANEGCDATFYNYPSHNRRYCSRSCMYPNRSIPTQEEKERLADINRAKMIAANRTGRRNPNYKNGKFVGKKAGVPRSWGPKAKGESCCRTCGSRDHLQLHHAVPRSVCPPEAKTDMRNGITLCASCHVRWHRGSLTITRNVFSVDEWDYVSNMTLTGRDIGGWLDKHYPLLMEVPG